MLSFRLSVPAVVVIVLCSCGPNKCPTPAPSPIALPDVQLGSLFQSLQNGNAGRIAQAESVLANSPGDFGELATECSPNCTIPSLQLGLNRQGFAGVQGGFGISLEAFLRDLTDFQCRKDLNSLSSSVGGKPYSTSCTPVAFGNFGVSPGCTDEAINDTPSCKATVGMGVGDCKSAGDDMGNPMGTFLSLAHFGEPNGQLFARFPDSVANGSLSSGLADLLRNCQELWIEADQAATFCS